jgi:hypothetical protein
MQFSGRACTSHARGSVPSNKNQIIILIILKCIVQWWVVHAPCHPSCKMEILYPLNINPRLLLPGSCHSPSCHYEFDHSKYNLFCLFPLTMMSSSFIKLWHMSECSWLWGLNNTPLCVCVLLFWWATHKQRRLGLFLPCDEGAQCCQESGVQLSLEDSAFSSFRCISRNGTAKSHGNYIIDFSLFVLFFFFPQYLGLNSGLCTFWFFET